MKAGESCRQAFAKELLELARKDPVITVLCSDSRGSCAMTDFAATLPNQFVECGIAEQDEVGIAAGLASVGMKPFICAPAAFLSARSLEQIKIDVAYSFQNVKILGVSGGISYGALGASHHTVHDIAVFRCFPDLSVVLPCDARQTKEMVDVLVKRNLPVYIRVGREGVPVVYGDDFHGNAFTFGKANCLRRGKDLTIIACGEMVAPALLAAEGLQKQGVGACVLDMATIKPLDRDAVLKAAEETGAILTCEEHSIFGGLGAAVAEVIVQEHPVPMEILGLPDSYLQTGASDDVKRYYHLDAEGIQTKALLLMEKKRS